VEAGVTEEGKGGGFETRKVASIAAAHAVHDTYTAFLPPLLPAFIQRLGLSRTQAGGLSVFLTLPNLLQPAFGRLADRWGLRHAVLAGPAAPAVAMSLLGVVAGYRELALLLLLAGISNTAFHAVAPAVIGSRSGRSIGRGMGFWMLGGELGRALGPLIVVSAIGAAGMHATVWLMAAGIAASIWLYAQPRADSEHRGKRPSGASWWAVLHDMRPVMMPLVGLVAVRAFVMSSLTVYLPTLLTEDGATVWSAGASLTILEAAGVAGALGGGWASDRLGRKQVIAASMLCTPPLMFAFLIAAGWLRVALLVALGGVALCTSPVIMAVVLESFPQHRAFANSIYMLMGSAVRSGAVLAIGAAGDRVGLHATFLASAALMLVGLPFVRALPKGGAATPAHR